MLFKLYRAHATQRRVQAFLVVKCHWIVRIAVTGLSRADILAAMRQRLARAPEDEFAEALTQIVRIANIRLDALLAA